MFTVRVMKEVHKCCHAASGDPPSRRAHLPGDVKRLKLRKIMLTRLREIVEKVASAPRLNEALNILVTDAIRLAMETEVCSVYLADRDHVATT